MAAWELWAPAAVAFGGTLGPALLATGRATRTTARAFVLGALATLMALLLVEVFSSRVATVVLDLALAAALVALAAVGTKREWAWTLVGLAAIAAARGVALVPMGLAVPAFLGPALLGAGAWLGASLLALSLAVVRVRASRRSTPPDTSLGGSRRS